MSTDAVKAAKSPTTVTTPPAFVLARAPASLSPLPPLAEMLKEKLVLPHPSSSRSTYWKTVKHKKKERAFLDGEGGVVVMLERGKNCHWFAHYPSAMSIIGNGLAAGCNTAAHEIPIGKRRLYLDIDKEGGGKSDEEVIAEVKRLLDPVLATLAPGLLVSWGICSASGWSDVKKKAQVTSLHMTVVVKDPKTGRQYAMEEADVERWAAIVSQYTATSWVSSYVDTGPITQGSLRMVTSAHPLDRNKERRLRVVEGSVEDCLISVAHYNEVGALDMSRVEVTDVWKKSQAAVIDSSDPTLAKMWRAVTRVHEGAVPTGAFRYAEDDPRDGPHYIQWFSRPPGEECMHGRVHKSRGTLVKLFMTGDGVMVTGHCLGRECKYNRPKTLLQETNVPRRSRKRRKPPLQPRNQRTPPH